MDSSGRCGRLVIIAVLAGVVLSGGAVGQETAPAWAGETEAALEQIVAGHNAAVDSASPGPAGSLVSDERVTLTVADVDGSVAHFSFRTDSELHVLDFQPGPHADATVQMFTDRATVTRIADAPDRAAAFEAAVRAGDIRIEGVGLTNRAVWALVGLALWALASPLQAAAVGAAALVGLGAAVVVGAKAVGGGAVVAGSAGAAGTTGTTGAGAAGTTGTTGTAGATGSAGTAGSSGAAGTGTASTTSSATTQAAGSAAGDSLGATGGNTMTAGATVDPVSIADQGLSLFERALFIVAIVKKLGARLRRGVGSAFARFLARFGFVRMLDEESAEAVTDSADHADSPRVRRRPVPRRRRR